MGNMNAVRDITKRERTEEGLRESEANFRLLFTAHPHPMWVYDLQTLQLLEVNDAAIAHYGYARDEFLQMRITDIQPAQEVSPVLEQTNLERPELQQSGQWRHRLKDGRVIDVELTSQTVEFAGRKAALIVAQDTTVRKRAQEALRESEEWLTRVVENNVDGILLINLDGRITFANAAAEQILGMPRGDLIQRTYNDPAWEFTTLEERKSFTEEHFPFARVMRTGEPVHGLELAIEHANGTRFFSMNAAPLRNTAGAVVSVVASLSDITTHKEVQRLKDEFVSTVSHELRTPLTSLRGFTELMLKREFALEKQREFLSILHGEACRLGTLIDDFLDLQRIEAGRQPYYFANLDLLPLLRETLTLFTRQDGIHTLRLEVPDPLPLVQADADRIRQVLSNLLSNALKFCPQGGTVTVGARLEGAHLVVWVADQGVGIPPEAIPKLFNKFFRVDSRETRGIGGTGLGLALVREIVAAHKGQVWVESLLGAGSTFFFTLPAAPTTPALAIPTAQSAKTVDIMVVEDDPAYARLLREQFEGAGFSILTTAYAEQALELVRQAPPRLVLADIHLAGRMDGWDLLMTLKSDEALQAIPVMIISTSDDINVWGLALDGADYLLKPVSLAWLLKAIQRRLPVLAGKRVLVVDDDIDLRSQMVHFLAAKGKLEVEEAANGREALARLEQRMPDLLVLDLLMPEMDGFAVLDQLRADKRAVNLPVLVMTGKDLLPREKMYIKHRLASLVSKKAVGLDHVAQIVRKTLGT